MTRVGFDGRALSSPAGGVRRYVRELFGALAARGDVEVMALGAHADVVLPYGIERPFGLHVGDVHPRRTIPTLVRAARRAGAAVVLAGADRDSARALASERDARIHAIPAADDTQLVALYRSASALVYPSR